MGEVLEFKRKKVVDKVFIEVQTQVLEDHSVMKV